MSELWRYDAFCWLFFTQEQTWIRRFPSWRGNQQRLKNCVACSYVFLRLYATEFYIVYIHASYENTEWCDVSQSPFCFLAAYSDCPQCVYNPAQKEGCCQAVAQSPGAVQVLPILSSGEWDARGVRWGLLYFNVNTDFICRKSFSEIPRSSPTTSTEVSWQHRWVATLFTVIRVGWPSSR